MKSKITITCQSIINKMNAAISDMGLNYSQNRDHILQILYDADEHLSIEEITQRVNDRFSSNLSKTTTYNIINFFEELQIVLCLELPHDMDKKAYYELNASYHHDHIVCTSCNKIIEFYDPQIEELQAFVCKKNGFLLFSHSLLLYGLCNECQSKQIV